MQLALRLGVAPFVLGVRWARRRSRCPRPDIPLPRRGPAVAFKVALDELLYATELISATIVSRRDHPRIAREIEEAVSLFEARGWLDDPARYHRTPPPLEPIRLDDVRVPGLAYRHLQFASDYEPHSDEPGRERWLGYVANRTAHAQLLMHPGRPRPWLVCIPGYRMGTPLVDFAGFRARWLHRTLGLNVAIPVLPLHGLRRMGRRSGDGFFSGDFLDTLHAQAQAVWDTRRLIRWLRGREAPAVGAYGVSLGGYTTALLASLEELDCVIAGVPATDFVQLLRTHAPAILFRDAAQAGFSFERAERMLRTVSPLAMSPRVPREHRFLYAGRADHLATPDHAYDLWEHWERPRMVWYHGGHVSFVWEPEVAALVREGVSAGGLLCPAPLANPSNA